MRRIFIPAWVLSTGSVLAGGVYVLTYKVRVAQAESYLELYAVMIGSHSALRLWSIMSCAAIGR